MINITKYKELQKAANEFLTSLGFEIIMLGNDEPPLYQSKDKQFLIGFESKKSFLYVPKRIETNEGGKDYAVIGSKLTFLKMRNLVNKFLNNGNEKCDKAKSGVKELSVAVN